MPIKGRGLHVTVIIGRSHLRQLRADIRSRPSRGRVAPLLLSRPVRPCESKSVATKWLNKPENRRHFTGISETVRVQEWRVRHSRYWRRKSSSAFDALPEPLRTVIREPRTKANQVALPSVPSGQLLQREPLVALVRHDQAAHFAVAQQRIEEAVHPAGGFPRAGAPVKKK